MEQLQIHSRSYIVRWINVNPNESISWSLQPHKKSLNFGIFKHPGGKAGNSPTLPGSATLDTNDHDVKPRRNSSAKDREAAASGVMEKLQSIGLKCMEWHGKCEADQVSMGKYDVHEGDQGMFGLVIDNTFSKTVAKTATFVLMTHPTNAPPKSGNQLRYSHAGAAGSTSTVGLSPSLKPTHPSTESLPHDIASNALTQKVSRRPSANSLASGFYTGIMHKKRRKKNQGYARRFFSLDFTSSTLSYYRSSHASALRGSVPLSLAAIGIDEKRKEFSIDSGAEVWHLRLRNKKDFDNWKFALERATSAAPQLISAEPASATSDVMSPLAFGDPLGEREWHRVEELISRVSGSRDAVRRLAHDTDPKLMTNGSNSPAHSPVDQASYFPDVAGKESQRLPFWKRKPSSSGDKASSASILRRSFSAQGAASPPTHTSTPLLPVPRLRTPSQAPISPDDIHERCLALLRDLDATVSSFSSLLSSSKARRKTVASKSASRMSMESTRSDEFVDALESTDDASRMLDIRNSDEVTEQDDFYSDEESITSSDGGDHLRTSALMSANTAEDQTLFPKLPKQITPATVDYVQGRPSIAPPRQPPPSIIGFLRKNAGKDLSTVAMPVTANEPTSLLQRLAEPLESAHLLSVATAASGPSKAIDRLVAVAAFAVATIASNRVKERAIRKPFNPMLGETYELIRHEDFDKSKPAYRFVAEKVTHHPVRMTWQADSLDGTWSLAQTPRPVQKFWGKSVELNTEGPFRLTLRSSAVAQTNGAKSPPGSAAEHYSWTAPTAYLRNVIAGEKYVEPVGSMTVQNETTGDKAIATFKASGLFSGRSEDVSITFHTASSTDVTVSGKWTTSLVRTDTGATVWTAPSVIPDAGKNWGFTAFAAKLNEITAVENGKLPPTDSRLRPDQRALEEGQLDKAEGIKARLEERQRARRKVLEAHGGVYKARFFERVEGTEGEEEVWRLKTGPEGYWEEREAGWRDVMEVFET